MKLRQPSSGHKLDQLPCWRRPGDDSLEEIVDEFEWCLFRSRAADADGYSFTVCPLPLMIEGLRSYSSQRFDAQLLGGVEQPQLRLTINGRRPVGVVVRNNALTSNCKLPKLIEIGVLLGFVPMRWHDVIGAAYSVVWIDIYQIAPIRCDENSRQPFSPGCDPLRSGSR